MRLGIAGVLPADPGRFDSEALARVRDLGFRDVSLFFGEAMSSVDASAADRIRGLLERAAVRPAELMHFPCSLISEDPAERARNVRLVHAACRLAARLGGPPVIIGSGSLNPKGDYLPHPENHSPRVRERLVRELREAVKGAEDSGVRLGLEPHTVIPLKDAATLRGIIEEVGSPALGAHVDPVNWVTFETVYQTGPFLDRIFDTLSPRYVFGLHAKGVSVQDRLIIHLDETYAGAPDDQLDYRTYIRRAAAVGPDIALVIEHTPVELIPRVREYLVRVAGEVGVSIES